jgi:iron complex outermembrane receptor protein
MKRLEMVCAFMMLFVTTLWAQGPVIKGSVVDQSGYAVERAAIHIPGTGIYTESDKNGKFEIEADAGELAFVSHVVYTDQTVELQNGIEIVLEERFYELDNIIVKADPFRNLAQSSIVYDDIKATTQPRNISDLFRDIPGFGIIKRGNYASEPAFRAFKYEQLNVQYDGGMKILNACPNRMDPITTHVIPEEIERIEIVKGPFTVRFGQNFGGIINMVSKSPGMQSLGWSGNAETGYETNGNNFTARGALTYKAEHYDIEGNVSYRNYGDYTDGNGDVVPSSFKTFDYSAKLGYNPGENQRLRLTWRQSFGRDIKHAGLPMDSPYDDSYLVGLDYRIKVPKSNIRSFMLKLFYSHVDHLMTNEDRPNFMMVEAESNVFVTTYGGKAELELTPTEKLSLFVGADANFIGREGDRIRTIKIMNGNPLPMPMVKVDKIWQDSKLDDLGVFAEAKLLAQDNSVFTAGIRTDFVNSSINDPEEDFLELYGGEIEDQQDFNVSGNFSYLVKWDQVQFQAAIGRGVRSASLLERYINHFNVGQDPYEYVGNPYLDPEVNHQIELSSDYRGLRLGFGGSVFYSFLTNYITAVVDEDLPRKFMPMQEPRFAKRFVNVDDAVQAGFEVFFNYYFNDRFSFLSDLSYTYGQNTDLDEPLPLIAPLTGHLGVKYERPKYWLNLKSRLVAEQNRVAESFGEVPSPGFVTFDFSAGYQPVEGLSVGAAVLNLFDTAYYEHLNFSYRNSDLLQGRIYEPGRNFTLYVNYSF